jgi:hypothetical protein
MLRSVFGVTVASDKRPDADRSMANESDSIIPRILKAHQAEILSEWVRQQRSLGGRLGAA